LQRLRGQEALAQSEASAAQLQRERDAIAQDCADLRASVQQLIARNTELRDEVGATSRTARESEETHKRERAEWQRTTARVTSDVDARLQSQAQELATARAEALAASRTVGQLTEQLEGLRGKEQEARELQRGQQRLQVGEVRLRKFQCPFPLLSLPPPSFLSFLPIPFLPYLCTRSLPAPNHPFSHATPQPQRPSPRRQS